MSKVLRGYCPDCGAAVLSAGALHYEDTGDRVIACTCGSRRALVDRGVTIRVEVGAGRRLRAEKREQ